jgi:lipid-binding SYLF domain-containing protein
MDSPACQEDTMNRLIALAATLALAAPALAGAAPVASKLDDRVAAANEVLQELNRIPEQAIPSALLNRAYAVAVVPGTIKGGFIVGGSFGKGVLVTRRPDGRWSNPAFITLANLGIGWQAGAQGSDLILVFKSRKGVENIERGKFTLGGSASAAAGPVGRTTVAATDGEFRAEIYTYARSRGLFAGVSLDGGALTFDHKANAAYYDGAASGTPTRILNDDGIPTPATARPFLATLAGMAPQLQWQGAAEARSAATPSPAPADAAARTYGMDEPAPAAKPAPETVF